MHEPRGVGLMHTRHKPSDAHYTHEVPCARKYSRRSRMSRFRVIMQPATGVLDCHFCQRRPPIPGMGPKPARRSSAVRTGPGSPRPEPGASKAGTRGIQHTGAVGLEAVRRCAASTFTQVHNTYAETLAVTAIT